MPVQQGSAWVMHKQHSCVCVHIYMCACIRACVHVCLVSAGVYAHVMPSRMHLCLEKPSPGKIPTFREMPSSENLLQRALKGLVSSSASLGSSRSAPREVLSARRSVPTSKRPSRCLAVPSRGRI